MNFNIDRLKSFSVVARTKNLSVAAIELGTTQPNLGRQMTALANEVNIPLFVRHSRGIALTEQGEEFLKVCEDIIGQFVQRTDIIRERVTEPQGILRMMVGVGATQIILDHLPSFALKFPKLRYKFSSVTNIFQFKMGDADVGIMAVRSSDPDLVQHHLYDMDLRIYASPTYLETHGHPTTLEDLCEHNIIVYIDDTPEITKSLMLHLTGDDAKDSKYINFIEANSGISLRKALLNGLGIGSFWYEADLIKEEQLIDVFPNMESRRIPHYFTYHRRLDNSPKVHVFHEFMKEIVKPFQMVAPSKKSSHS